MTLENGIKFHEMLKLIAFSKQNTSIRITMEKEALVIFATKKDERKELK